MVNTQLFPSLKGALLPDATARNHEQAPAYALSARHQAEQGFIDPGHRFLV